MKFRFNIVLVLFACVVFRQEARAELNAKLLAGPEYDTNATREVSGETREDTLFKLYLHVPFKYAFTESDRLWLDYKAGGKKFFAERSEDTVLNQLDAGFRHLSGAGVAAGAEAGIKHRLLRDNERGYLFSSGRLTAASPAGFAETPFEVSAWAGGRYFRFASSGLYTYSEPFAGAMLSLPAGERLLPFILYELGFRSFENPLDAEGKHIWRSARNGGTCSHDNRADWTHAASAGVRLEHEVRCSLAYAMLHTDSNCDRWSSVKHRLTALLAAKLGAGVFFNAMAALQKASYFDGVPYNLDIGDEDEQQNMLSLKLSKSVSPALGIELGYSFYGNEFRNSGYRFSRHTFFAGPSLRF